MLHLSLGGGNAAVQAMLQEQGVADFLQRGENLLWSASSAAQVVSGRQLDLACELPVEFFYDLGL